MVSTAQSARRIVQLRPDGDGRGTAAQPDARALPREARARLGRLLGVVLSKINLEPRLQPGPFLSASRALVWETSSSTQRFSNPFGPSKPLIFLTQFKGCVRSVLVERAGLPRCPNLGSAQEG